MGLIPQTKCSRCDRSYSGLRSRCPYCGARRSSKGKRATDTDNATWKLIIGIVLIVVLIAAVIVILVTSLSGDANTPADNDNKGQGFSHGDGANNMEGKDPTGENNGEGNGEGEDGSDPGNSGENNGDDDDNNTQDPPEDNTPTTPVSPLAQSITVKTQYGGAATDHTLKVAEECRFDATILPTDCTSVPVWTSSDERVASVVPKDATGMSATVTAISRGSATITVTVDGLSTSFVIRCNG